MIQIIMKKLFNNIDINGNIIYEPQDKQMQFHHLIDNRNENGYRKYFYGGAAKGGKSYAMRWQGVKDCIEYQGIRILLIRSSLKELQNTHLDFIQREIPPALGTYNGQDKRLTIHSTNRNYFTADSILQFGYLDHDKDIENYLGTSWDVIMIDELTTIKFKLILLLMSRLTASRSDFTPYFMAASNPGSISHLEVKSYFIDKDFKEEYPELSGRYNKDEIIFLPATIYDNPKQIAKDPEIVKRLEELPEMERRRFLYGDWNLVEGNFFNEFDMRTHVIKPFNIPEHWIKRAGLDYGNVTCAEFIAQDPNTEIIYVYNEVTYEKESKEIKANKLKIFLEEIGEKDIQVVADTNIKATYAEMPNERAPINEFEEAGINIHTVTKKRNADNKLFRRWINDELTNKLHWKKQENGLWLKKPQIYFFEGRCPKLIKTLPALIVSETDIEDYNKEQDKIIGHWTKALQYALIDLGRPITQKERTRREQLKKRKRTISFT